MYTERTSVGLDVHARSTMAWGLDTATGEIFTERLVPATTEILAWLHRLPGPVAVAYEAGRTGFGLARALEEAGIRCVLVAPSKMERPSGDRVKTDRRDAERLAKLLRLDELPAVRVPTIEQESARDLTRTRDDVRADLMRARHRLSKLLLRQGIVYSGGKAWTAAHPQWLSGHRFEYLGLRAAYDEALEAVLALEARRDRLDAAIAQLAAQPSWAPVVARLACLRGVSTLTAFGLAVEIGDWHRFTGAYLGLVPTEDSSVESTLTIDQSIRPSASASARMAAKILSQVPSADQRLCRSYAVFHGPKRAGRSRHGTPVRSRYKIPLMILR
jgi:transposase